MVMFLSLVKSRVRGGIDGHLCHSESSALVNYCGPACSACQEHCSRKLTVLSPVRQDRGMAGTPRERAREQTISDIIRIGREQLSQVGAAALSLRAVAR